MVVRVAILQLVHDVLLLPLRDVGVFVLGDRRRRLAHGGHRCMDQLQNAHYLISFKDFTHH